MRVDPTSQVDPERDFVRDQIRKLAELLAKVLLKRGSATEVDQKAEDEFATAAGQLLGHPFEMLERLAPASVALVLGRERERLRVYAEILGAKAEALRHAGDAVGADRVTARARAILECA